MPVLTPASKPWEARMRRRRERRAWVALLLLGLVALTLWSARELLT